MFEAFVFILLLAIPGAGIVLALKYVLGRPNYEFRKARFARFKTRAKLKYEARRRRHEPLLPREAYNSDFEPLNDFIDPAERIQTPLRGHTRPIRPGSHDVWLAFNNETASQLEGIFRILIVYDAPMGYGVWEIFLMHQHKITAIVPRYPNGLESFVELGNRLGFDAMRIYDRTNTRIRRAKKTSFEEVIWESRAR